MATRSRIGIENQDGTVSSIYCHWDGYPSHNGEILSLYYKERDRVQRLIGLGDISVLCENLSPMGDHSFNSPEKGVTVAYHRDRGEDYNPPRIDSSVEAYFESDIEEWGYVFTLEGKWEWKAGK